MLQDTMYGQEQGGHHNRTLRCQHSRIRIYLAGCGTSSQWYRTFHDIGSGQSTLGHDIVNIASQSDLLSADPYTAGHAWGSLTVDVEVAVVT